MATKRPIYINSSGIIQIMDTSTNLIDTDYPKWFYGSGSPSSLFGDKNGDYYVNILTGAIWKKDSDAWSYDSITLSGLFWSSGVGSPDNINGNDRDLYLDLANGNVYQKSGGTWSLAFNLVGPEGVNLVSVTNGESVSITRGQATYISAANTIKLAKANSILTSDVFGLVSDASIAAGASGYIQVDGYLGGITNPTLEIGNRYYLSDTTSGLITNIPPSSVGSYVVRLGMALSTSEIKVNIDYPIQLEQYG